MKVGSWLLIFFNESHFKCKTEERIYRVDLFSSFSCLLLYDEDEERHGSHSREDQENVIMQLMPSLPACSVYLLGFHYQ